MRLTLNMLWVLRRLYAGDPPDVGCNTQSDYGGRHGTLQALVRRGFIDNDFKVTDAGRRLLDHAETRTDAKGVQSWLRGY